MSNLLHELKRRNVLRVAVLYAVVAWVTLQVAELIFGVLGVPAWSSKLVLVLLALGLPVVLIFAWAFEITPEGIKRESEVDRTQSITHDTGRKLNVITVIMAGVAILLIAAQSFVPGLRPASRNSGATKSSEVATASIAVLPFVNMSSDKEQEYFSDGLSEELLNLLAKIPQLTVISRTSSFQFKDTKEDVRTIGQKLGVAHVLEGSVRKSNNKVRITAQLIKASDGTHVWSETFDKTLDDIFAVQDEIAAEVVKALQLSLLGKVPQTYAAPANAEAYNLVLQARYLNDQRTTESYKTALEHLDSALALDRNYAVAWAEKARVITRQLGSVDVPIEVGLPQVRAAAGRALELDPKLPEAHVQLASLELTYNWDWTAAERYLRAAEALDPANYLFLNIKANLASTLGRFSEAIGLYRRATQLNPLNVIAFSNLGLALVRVDSASAAVTAFRKALALTPEAGGIHSSMSIALLTQSKGHEALTEVLAEPSEFWRAATLPLVYHALGRRSDSDKALRDLEQRFAADGAYQMAEAHAYRGEADLAFKWLDRAYEQRDGGLTELLGDPLMKNIVGDSRYRALLRKLKLPES